MDMVTDNGGGGGGGGGGSGGSVCADDESTRRVLLHMSKVRACVFVCAGPIALFLSSFHDMRCRIILLSVCAL